jgi:hypothetical protein
MMVGPGPKYNLSVFLPTFRENTRNEADYRRPKYVTLAESSARCSLVDVVAALPQGAETFRLIRYPSPLGGSVPVCTGRPFFISNSNACAEQPAHLVC